MLNAPRVSICCITYNHEKYISRTINSFLEQVTDFPVEILIYDDASTDSTTEIIRQYAGKYPSIIPILQSENQYSQGIRPMFEFVFPKVRGEYIALCEGDDYWTDPNKIQKQIEALERHPSCSLCFHPAVEVYADTTLNDRVICNHDDAECVFNLNDVILGGGTFMPTASLFFKSDVVQRLPSWFSQVPVGDTFLQIYASGEAGAVFIPEVMSVYRRFVKGSWTENNNKTRQFNSNMYRKFVYFYQLMKKDFQCHQAVLDFCIAFLSKQLQLNEAHSPSFLD